MQKDNRRGLEDHQISLALEDGGECYLYSLGSRHAEIEDRMQRERGGFVIKSGEIETASGHRFYALLEVCAPDSYEHYATGVVVPGVASVPEDRERTPASEASVEEPGEERGAGPHPAVTVLWQGDEDFHAWLEREEKADPSFRFFPYRYMYYDDRDREDDFHVGPNGWSGR